MLVQWPSSAAWEWLCSCSCSFGAPEHTDCASVVLCALWGSDTPVTQVPFTVWAALVAVKSRSILPKHILLHSLLPGVDLELQPHCDTGCCCKADLRAAGHRLDGNCHHQAWWSRVFEQLHTAAFGEQPIHVLGVLKLWWEAVRVQRKKKKGGKPVVPPFTAGTSSVCPVSWGEQDSLSLSFKLLEGTLRKS